MWLISNSAIHNLIGEFWVLGASRRLVTAVRSTFFCFSPLRIALAVEWYCSAVNCRMPDPFGASLSFCRCAHGYLDGVWDLLQMGSPVFCIHNSRWVGRAVQAALWLELVGGGRYCHDVAPPLRLPCTCGESPRAL